MPQATAVKLVQLGEEYRSESAGRCRKIFFKRTASTIQNLFFP